MVCSIHLIQSNKTKIRKWSKMKMVEMEGFFSVYIHHRCISVCAYGSVCVLWSGITFHLQQGKTQTCIFLFLFSPASLSFSPQLSPSLIPRFLCVVEMKTKQSWTRSLLSDTHTHTDRHACTCTCTHTLPVWSCVCLCVCAHSCACLFILRSI